MQVTGLFIYPIKGLAGVSLSEANLEQRGLAYDRRWMLVDEEGVFISQREVNKMALLKPEMTGKELIIHASHLSIGPLRVPLKPATVSQQIQVQVWENSCEAQFVSPAADRWLSRVLGANCRLVYMPDSSIRPLKATYGLPGEMVGFADSCPLLVLGEASLADLNNRLEHPVPIDRFRPNIVFSGGQPYEEESWRNFHIGAVSLRGIRTCARCQVITIDQQSAKIGQEPLRTLSTYRRQGNKVLFGLYASLAKAGENGSALLRVGDRISIEGG